MYLLNFSKKSENYVKNQNENIHQKKNRLLGKIIENNFIIDLKL